MAKTAKVEGKPVDIKAAAYCVKCKRKRRINDPHLVVLKNKRRALKGLCECGTKIMRFLPNKKAA